MESFDLSYIKAGLRRHGMPMSLISSLLRDLYQREARVLHKSPVGEWKALTAPLTKLIRGLQSTKCRWGADPHRGPLYAKYLTLLLVTRQTIRNTEAANMGRKRLPELAQEMQLSGRGTRWQDWVPPALIQKVLISFDKLYTITLPAAFPEKYGRTSGKRLMPFSDKEHRNASDRRWDAVLLYCTAEKEGKRHEAGFVPYIECLEFVIDVVLNREEKDVAPLGGGHAAWEKLLDAQHKAKYKEWADTTLFGLDTVNLEPAQQAAHEAAAERNRVKHAQLVAKRDRQREYMAQYRKVKLTKDGKVRTRRTKEEMESDYERRNALAGEARVAPLTKPKSTNWLEE